MTKGTRGPEGPETVMAEIVEKRGPEWTRPDQSGPGDQGTGEGDRRDLAINRDQRGPEGPATDEGISLLIGTRGDQRDR